MCSYIKDNEDNGKTCIGIKTNVFKKEITHENYKQILFESKQIHHKMKTIRSEKHELQSYEINTVSLSCIEDKRYISKDGIKSFSSGIYKKIYAIYFLLNYLLL